MSRITIDIGFYFENDHYAQLHGFLPSTEAAKIPQLKSYLRQQVFQPTVEVTGRKAIKGDSKPASDDEMLDEEDVPNEGEEDDLPIDGENGENEDEDEIIDEDQQQEVENVLHQLEVEEEAEGESESYDSDREDDMEDASLSSPEQMRNFNNNRTKRQKGEIKDLIELPDRRPRKGKMLDEATEVIRREDKEKKRKQYLKKQIEAHEKATIDKILNETGRKLRMREEKELQDELMRENKFFRSLGDVPKIIEIINDQGKLVMLHKGGMFPASMTTAPDLKMKELCSKCGNTSKYTLKGGQKYACSLPCYKVLTV